MYEGVEGNAEGQDIRYITLPLEGKVDTIYSLENAYTPPPAADSSSAASPAPTPVPDTSAGPSEL